MEIQKQNKKIKIIFWTILSISLVLLIAGLGVKIYNQIQNSSSANYLANIDAIDSLSEKWFKNKLEWNFILGPNGYFTFKNVDWSIDFMRMDAIGNIILIVGYVLLMIATVVLFFKKTEKNATNNEQQIEEYKDNSTEELLEQNVEEKQQPTNSQIYIENITLNVGENSDNVIDQPNLEQVEINSELNQKFRITRWVKKRNQIGKKQIISEISEDIQKQGNSIPKTHILAIYESLFETVYEQISNEEEVMIKGFGKFKPKTTEAKEVINPLTGEMISKPAEKTFKFNLSKKVKDDVKTETNLRTPLVQKEFVVTQEKMQEDDQIIEVINIETEEVNNA